MVNLPESTSQRWTRLSQEANRQVLEDAPHAFQQSRCFDPAAGSAQRQADAVSMPPPVDNSLRHMEMPLGATVPFSRWASDYASVNMHATPPSATSELHENSGRSQLSRGNSDGGSGQEAKEQPEIVRAQNNEQVGVRVDVSSEAMLEDELLDEESLDVLVSKLARETAHIYPIESICKGRKGPDITSSNNSSVDDDDRRSYECERSSNNDERTFGDSDSSALSSPAATPFASKKRTTPSEPTSSSSKQKQKRIRKACSVPNCGKRSRSQGLCIAHGGGRRCIVDGCDKSSQGGNLCIKHGGGKRCSIEGCDKAAQTNALCKAHGGGPRCQFENCEKSSQGGGYCRTHGGGKRCAHGGCMKGTQRGNFCAIHGGLRLCIVEGCLRNDRGGGFCAHHGGGKRCSIEGCDRACRRNGLCSSHLRLLGHMRVEDLLESLRVHSSPPPYRSNNENQ